MNLEFLQGMFIMGLIVLFVIYAIPLIRNRGYEQIYDDVELALLLAGYAFRDEKVKAITDMIMKIVQEAEKLQAAPSDKLDFAIEKAFKTLVEELNLEIKEDAIKTIVRIAVKQLPPTHVEVEVK